MGVVGNEHCHVMQPQHLKNQYTLRVKPSLGKAPQKKPVKPWIVQVKWELDGFPKLNEWTNHSRYATKRDALKGLKDLAGRQNNYHGNWEYRLVEPEREKK